MMVPSPQTATQTTPTSPTQTTTTTTTPILFLKKTNELVENAKKHIQFLESLHALGVTLTKPSRHSLKRYHMWLTMVHAITNTNNNNNNNNTKQSSSTTTTLKKKKEDDDDEEDIIATTTKLKLIPPADIAWIWHCHRLAPLRYIEYLQKEFHFGFDNNNNNNNDDHDHHNNNETTAKSVVFGSGGGGSTIILEADPPFEFQHPLLHDDYIEDNDDDGMKKFHKKNTRKIWSEYYPNENFDFVDIPRMEDDDQQQEEYNNNNNGRRRSGNDDDDDCYNDYSSSKYWCGFDLIGSTERQCGFLWQVTQSNFLLSSNDDFLFRGVEQYYKFLCLKTKVNNFCHQNNNMFMLVPTYQIDLMWHTHILTNLQEYFDDCRMVMDGQILHHDDSLTDRTEGGSLDQAFKETKKLWKHVFDGEEYYIEGGMYRGEPPEEYFQKSWPGNHRASQASSIGIGPFIGMINIQGATSTSPAQWTSSDGIAPDGNPGFIKPNNKSTSRGVNANTLKEGYIFGKGPKGLGYYHNTTRESYVILHQRITVRAEALQQSIACDQCCGGQPNKSKVDEYNNLMDIKDVVKSRMQSSTPQGDLNIPEEIKAHMRTRGNYNTYYSDAGMWYFPPDFCDAGGGCGACGVGGGGCGGGAAGCGAAGCGAAGCGGGGCGGGGCGG